MSRKCMVLSACLTLGIVVPAHANPSMAQDLSTPRPAKGRVASHKKVYGARSAVPKLKASVTGFDPEFAAVVSHALEQSPAIAAARTDATAAGVDLRATRWRRLPTVSVSGNYYGVQGGAPKRLTPSVSVDLVLWNAGRTSGEIERAKGSRHAAEARLLESQLEVALQVTNLFYDLKKMSERIAIVRRNLGELQTMQDGMSRRVQQEVSPRSDLQLAMTRTMQVNIMLDSLLAQRRILLQRLREQLQDETWQPQERSIELGGKLSTELDDMIGLAEEFDPQRIRLEAEASIAKADAKIVAAGRFPSLAAEYTYDDVYRHRVGVVLRGQTNGLSEFGQAHAAALRENAADQRVELAARDLRAQITSDYVDYTSSLSRFDLVHNASATTDAVRDSYIRQFISGRRTWLDVMNAVREAMSAQLDAVDVRYTAAQAQARLMIRMGNLPAETEGSN